MNITRLSNRCIIGLAHAMSLMVISRYALRKISVVACCRCCVLFVCLSFRPSEPKSPKIDSVGNNFSLRQRLVDQGVSISFWNIQGHSEHIKESFMYEVHISSEIFHSWAYTLPGTMVTQSNFERSRSLSVCILFEKNKSSFSSLDRYLITYYHVSVMYMPFRQWSLKVILDRSRPFNMLFLLGKKSLFNIFLNRHWSYTCKLTTGEGNSEHIPSM
jgi:hypothetical protein